MIKASYIVALVLILHVKFSSKVLICRNEKGYSWLLCFINEVITLRGAESINKLFDAVIQDEDAETANIKTVC